MRDKPTTALLVTLLFVLVLATSFSADAQMAKEGDLSGTHYLSGTFKATKVGDDFLLVTSENTGLLVSNFGAGPFDHITVRCVSQVVYVKGIGRNQGNCVYVDRPGDQFISEFSAPEQKLGATTSNGTFRFLGGTGKFAGLSAEGEYTFTSLRSVAEGTYQGYSKFKGRYRLE
jgi:hypothetical protein